VRRRRCDRGRHDRRWVSLGVLAAVIVAGGVVVTQFLSPAIDYYCNVDEVGVRDGCEADRRLRVQGTVEQGSIKQAAGTTTFLMSFNAKNLDVRYDGDPGGVFQECIPVVAHGRLVNGVFLSDRIEVKHSNTYVAKNENRMDEAEEAAECLQSCGLAASPARSAAAPCSSGWWPPPSVPSPRSRPRASRRVAKRCARPGWFRASSVSRSSRHSGQWSRWSGR